MRLRDMACTLPDDAGRTPDLRLTNQGTGVSPLTRQPQFVPHPAEVIPAHRPHIGPGRTGFQETQPLHDQLAARCRPDRLSRGLALQHGNGLIQGVAVVAVHVGVDDLARGLGRDFLERGRGLVEVRSARLIERLDRRQGRAQQGARGLADHRRPAGRAFSGVHLQHQRLVAQLERAKDRAALQRDLAALPLSGEPDPALGPVGGEVGQTVDRLGDRRALHGNRA